MHLLLYSTSYQGSTKRLILLKISPLFTCRIPSPAGICSFKSCSFYDKLFITFCSYLESSRVFRGPISPSGSCWSLPCLYGAMFGWDVPTRVDPLLLAVSLFSDSRLRKQTKALSSQPHLVQTTQLAMAVRHDEYYLDDGDVIFRVGSQTSFCVDVLTPRRWRIKFSKSTSGLSRIVKLAHLGLCSIYEDHHKRRAKPTRGRLF